MDGLPDCMGCRLMATSALVRKTAPAPCNRCRRLVAVGAMVQAIISAHSTWQALFLEDLDALATILSTYRWELNRARRERNEDQRDFQRDARDIASESFAAGREAGQGE